MKTLHSFTQLIDCQQPIHWAAGFFDGVHEGHKRVILSADTPGALRGVLTFSPHPLALLKPEAAPSLLTPYCEQKEALLQALGVDILLELPFTRELAAMPPQEFISTLCSVCKVAGISVGNNWHFGKGGEGNAAFLQAEAAHRGFRACVSDMLLQEGEIVCSSRIRTLLKEGNIERVNRMLGRSFSVFGRVEHGQKLARKLGFPTANIALPASAALPKAGVYGVSASIHGTICRGIANIGLRPTIDEEVKITRLEAHFPEWKNGDFYGEKLEVNLHSFIREERKFDSIESLKKQIESDISALNL